ncbi:hypothetical protein ACTAQI_20200 [Pseudarthrobacter sp. alpha12b]
MNQELQAPIGYVVVDRVTKEIDWDCELHTSIDQAIRSLTAPQQMYCKTFEEETEDKTYWAKHYMICPVGQEIGAIVQPADHNEAVCSAGLTMCHECHCAAADLGEAV